MSNNNYQQILEVARLIHQSDHIIALTGAGISTAAGIPDFRSESSSLWQHADPLQVASLIGFRQDYHPFFNWIRPLLQQIQQAEPSAGHHFLAYLEQLGKLKAVITQNVDSLHTKAGNTTVYELHGHCRTATCTHCFRKFDATALLEALIKTGEIPMCACQPAGSVIKPDVILFGEQLPVKVVQATRRALIQADLLLVMGSSLQAEPAANIPYIVAEHGVKLVIINDEPTHIDSLAHVVLRGNIEGYIEPIIEVLETSYERS